MYFLYLIEMTKHSTLFGLLVQLVEQGFTLKIEYKKSDFVFAWISWVPQQQIRCQTHFIIYFFDFVCQF